MKTLIIHISASSMKKMKKKKNWIKSSTLK